MIQDIYPHKLDVSYRPNENPKKDSLIIHFIERQFLCKMDEEGNVELPRYEDYPKDDLNPVYLFKLDDTTVFLDLGEEGPVMPGFGYESINLFRGGHPQEILFALITAYHLSVWHNDNICCGRCGARTVHDEKERMLKCPVCGNTIYPRIMPSVIVGVTKGDSILMTRYNRPGAKLSALVAGFCEIGETGEDTVRREVMEETGIRVKNIKYYKSQPWGITAGGLLLGYFCEQDGDDPLKADGDELAEAVWVKREDLQEYTDGSYTALTSEMISVFARGEENNYFSY